ncbi:MAG: TIR domain-containing protein [Opitutaceae bacterium]|nr:TIR domain-containing protein [Opitutaceae bacterium]
MSISGKAVFLSYASQDAEAARRIADALRAAGVEVWFDQSELRGGDVWDQKIRKQIKECALFVPVISANTNARAEGYFRLEWKLAVDRSHLMADDAPFLFPVVIDDTSDATARVPDRFREVQWTRLNVKDTPETLADRVVKLLGGEIIGPGADRAPGHWPGLQPQRPPPRIWLLPALGVLAILIVAAFFAIRPHRSPAEIARLLATAETVAARAAAKSALAAAPLSEARQLAARARAMSLDKYDSTAEDFAAAEGLLKRALQLDPNDAEIWAVSSLLNFSFRSRGFDHAQARAAAARSQAERALSLDPDSLEGQFALGRWQRDFEDPAVAEATFKKILSRQPNHAGALGNLAWIYDRLDRVDESAALYERVAAQPDGNPALARYTEFLLFFHRARFEEADRCIRQSVAAQPSANSQSMLAILMLTWKGDADGAARMLASGPTAVRNEPRTIWTTAMVQLCQRTPEATLKTLDRFSDDYIQDNWFAGPKTYWTGRAHALAGRKEAARLAWEAGLAVVDARLKATPQARDLHLMRGELLAWLGQANEALREARTAAELSRSDRTAWFSSEARIYAVLGRADEALPWLEKFRAAAVGRNVGWPLTAALLRLDPLWDKLRDDSRFQTLLKEPGK